MPTDLDKFYFLRKVKTTPDGSENGVLVHRSRSLALLEDLAPNSMHLALRSSRRWLSWSSAERSSVHGGGKGGGVVRGQYSV